MNEVPLALRAVLEDAQRAGMVGSGDVAKTVAHALEFFRPLPDPQASWCIDLGSGAGVPGLPLALAYPATRWALVDAWAARCDALARGVAALGLLGRVEVVHARAEELAHRPGWRGLADRLVVRSFGPPPTTAECAAALVRPGGLLVVSVAQGASWPDRVPELSLELASAWRSEAGTFRAYVVTGTVDPRFPRRPAAQRRRPVF